MKIRILLILLLFYPFVMKGQVTQSGVDKTTEETFKTVFYNKGKMFVGENKPTSTTEIPAVYVHGSVKLADGSEIDQQGITTITGDFINAQTTTATPNNIFTYSGKKGTIRFANPMSSLTQNKPFQFPLGGNDTDIGKGTLSSLDLDLNYKQEIKFEGSADKGANYINFPNIELLDKTYVALNSNASATAATITTQPGALFSIEGRYTTVSNGFSGSTNRAVEYGHLILESAAERKASTTETDFRKKNSYHMLDLQLYDYNDPATTNNALTSGLGYAPVNLSGLTSPYSSLVQDYFFFHTLFTPNNLWDNSVDQPNVDPRLKIQPGEGYVVAMNLSNFDWDLIERDWKISRTSRASGGFQLSTLLLSRKPGFIALGRTWGDPVVGDVSEANYNAHLADETFLDKTKNISVTVKSNSKQKFFLANPFMAPLDLADIVNPVGGYAFGLATGSTYASNEILNKFWILSESALTYNTGAMKNLYKLHYYSNLASGSTAFLETPATGQYYIAPMQVFVVQTGGAITAASRFTFDTSKLGHAKVYATKSNKEIVDELLIQIVNEENGSEDRHAIVLSDNAKDASDDLLDDKKDDLEYKFKINNTTYTESREGAVYTKSSDNVAMRTNAVPVTTKQLPLYVTPTEVTQKMVLRPYRLESLQSVEGVWLEDKALNTVTHLTPGTEYPFESTVSTDAKAKENRFVLHFAAVDNDDILNEVDSPIWCHYDKSVLYLRGLNSGDINSNVDIFDIQGRLIGKTKINNTEFGHSIHLTPGTYIVKVTGKRNYTAKFLSTQN